MAGARAGARFNSRERSRSRQRSSRLFVRRRSGNFFACLSSGRTAVGSCRSRCSGCSNHPRPTNCRQVFPLR